MCKDVGSYPEGCTCPGYVDETDKTPGETTWDELLTYMSDLVAWGKETRKSDAKMSVLQHKLHDVCVTMCKELGAYPEKCTCPGYVDTTDKTPGVMTWDELLTYMDDVSSNGHAAIKDWKAAAR